MTATDVGPIFMDATTVTFDESPESYSAGIAEEIDNVPENASGLFCDHPGCHNELTYSGRGRRPKKCAEHKKSGTRTDKSPSSQVPRGIGKIREDVRDAMYGLGMMVSPYDKYDAAVLISRADPTAEVIALLAARYPKFRQYLEKGGDGMLWFKVGMTAASVAIPILAHHGMLPIDERIAYQKFVDPSISVE